MASATGFSSILQAHFIEKTAKMPFSLIFGFTSALRGASTETIQHISSLIQHQETDIRMFEENSRQSESIYKTMIDLFKHKDTPQFKNDDYENARARYCALDVEQSKISSRLEARNEELRQITANKENRPNV